MIPCLIDCVPESLIFVLNQRRVPVRFSQRVIRPGLSDNMLCQWISKWRSWSVHNPSTCSNEKLDSTLHPVFANFYKARIGILGRVPIIDCVPSKFVKSEWNESSGTDSPSLGSSLRSLPVTIVETPYWRGNTSCNIIGLVKRFNSIIYSDEDIAKGSLKYFSSIRKRVAVNVGVSNDSIPIF